MMAVQNRNFAWSRLGIFSIANVQSLRIHLIIIIKMLTSLMRNPRVFCANLTPIASFQFSETIKSSDYSRVGYNLFVNSQLPYRIIRRLILV